jgi:hypothetical protein
VGRCLFLGWLCFDLLVLGYAVWGGKEAAVYVYAEAFFTVISSPAIFLWVS